MFNRVLDATLRQLPRAPLSFKHTPQEFALTVSAVRAIIRDQSEPVVRSGVFFADEAVCHPAILEHTRDHPEGSFVYPLILLYDVPEPEHRCRLLAVDNPTRNTFECGGSQPGRIGLDGYSESRFTDVYSIERLLLIAALSARFRYTFLHHIAQRIQAVDEEDVRHIVAQWPNLDARSFYVSGLPCAAVIDRDGHVCAQMVPCPDHPLGRVPNVDVAPEPVPFIVPEWGPELELNPRYRCLSAGPDMPVDVRRRLVAELSAFLHSLPDDILMETDFGVCYTRMASTVIGRALGIDLFFGEFPFLWEVGEDNLLHSDDLKVIQWTGRLIQRTLREGRPAVLEVSVRGAEGGIGHAALVVLDSDGSTSFYEPKEGSGMLGTEAPFPNTRAGFVGPHLQWRLESTGLYHSICSPVTTLILVGMKVLNTWNPDTVDQIVQDILDERPALVHKALRHFIALSKQWSPKLLDSVNPDSNWIYSDDVVHVKLPWISGSARVADPIDQIEWPGDLDWMPLHRFLD